MVIPEDDRVWMENNWMGDSSDEDDFEEVEDDYYDEEDCED
jgi:hypothetical protein